MKKNKFILPVVLTLAFIFSFSSCDKKYLPEATNDQIIAVIPDPKLVETEITTEIPTETTTEVEPTLSFDEVTPIADDFSPSCSSEYKKTSRISEEMFLENLEKLNGLQNYGAEFTVEYISTDENADVRFETLNEIKAIADEICNGLSTDKEKADAIAYWVCENIFYNMDAAHNDVSLEVTNLKTTFDERITTCAGYSNSFSALCNSQGIYSVSLRGGTLEFIGDTLETVPTNHEWNGVYIDGEWIFYDTAWASFNDYQNGKFIKTKFIDKNYLGMDFYTMSLTRRIDIVDFRNFYSSFNEFYSD